MKTQHALIAGLMLCLPLTALGQQSSVQALNDAIRRDLTLLGTVLSSVLALLQAYYLSAALMACITRGDIWAATKLLVLCFLLPSAIMSYLLFL